MTLADQKFTIRQVAEIHGEKIPTLQSWADKGWARITPAPGPGQARELSLMDVYSLSIAITLTRIGVSPQTANNAAWAAFYQPGGERDECRERARARVAREHGYTDWTTYCLKTPVPPGTTEADLVNITLADLDPAFHNRDLNNPYILFLRAGSFTVHQGPIVHDINPCVQVEVVPVRTWTKRLREFAFTVFGGCGFYVQLTHLLLSVDEMLKDKIGIPSDLVPHKK